jgi:hypothetical protein
MDEEVVIAISLAAVIGGGVRAMILAFALKRDEAHPVDRARAALVIFALISAGGLVGLVWILAS